MALNRFSNYKTLLAGAGVRIQQKHNDDNNDVGLPNGCSSDRLGEKRRTCPIVRLSVQEHN